jgi:hypothetical protein
MSIHTLTLGRRLGARRVFSAIMQRLGERFERGRHFDGDVTASGRSRGTRSSYLVCPRRDILASAGR